VFYWLGIILLCGGLMLFMLKVEMPDAIIQAFSRFKLVHFAGLTLLYFLLLRWESGFSRLIGFLLATLVYMLPLALRISTGFSSATVIGGFIPYKDGFYYYNGANMLLAGMPIPQDGLQGAFRPLFPGLLAIILFLTSRNLLLTLGLMVLGAAMTAYAAALAVREQHGSLPAALFFTLMYAFIRPMLGDTLAEIPSLALACLSLCLLFRTAQTKSWPEAMLGGSLLILALSIRAGAFFMLPGLVLWLGWLMRAERKFSLKWMLIFSFVMIGVFLLANLVFPRLVSEGGGSAFGNFSWMLYGQAAGGAGWDYHVKTLGTSDPGIVLQAALQRIQKHPLGLAIGFYKAYRDFFSNNSRGMFDLLAGERSALNWVFWTGCVLLLLSGLVKMLKNHRESVHALLLACFLGVLFSIPFLPPIDGGNRFYSASVPFLFALMAAGLPSMKENAASFEKQAGFGGLSVFQSCCLAGGMLLLLVGVWLMRATHAADLPGTIECGEQQMAITARFDRGSYVDILPEGSADCGLAPAVCLAEFAQNGRDQSTDDFFNKLMEFGSVWPQGYRLWADVEMNSKQYYFFIFPMKSAAEIRSGDYFSACALKQETRFQRILQIAGFE